MHHRSIQTAWECVNGATVLKILGPVQGWSPAQVLLVPDFPSNSAFVINFKQVCQALRLSRIIRIYSKVFFFYFI